jgi:Mrp family chromosome partitioning ATPase
VPSRPGLLDYLAGDASMKDALHGSNSRTLSIIPHGTKREHGPELLASEGMAHLIATLEAEYDAIIVDSPPLGANIDPFALGTTTGNMLLVLRSGETDRRVAETKVKTLEHFPIHVLGVVLNDFDLEGPYQQYPYLYGYGALVDEGTPKRSARSGQITRFVEAEPLRRPDSTPDA